jgi:phage gp45-like
VNCKHATINAEDDATVNTKIATIKASTSTKIDSPATTVTGTMTVQGLLTYQAGMVGSGGSGAALTGAMTVNGDVATTGGLTNNGKNVGSTLRVTGIQPGGGTSGVPV